MLRGRRSWSRGQPRSPAFRLQFTVVVALTIIALVAAGAASARPPSAEATSVVVGPYVTNVTATSFAVSWVTETPSEGHVKYGTESGRYPSRADDERGASYVGYTHLVRVNGLLGASTKYYYTVVSGETTLDSPSTSFVITGPTAASASEFLVNGQIQKTDNSEASGALVYVYPQRQANQTGYAPSWMVRLATLTDGDGHFSVDLGPARLPTTAVEKSVGNAFGALAVGDRVRYKAIGGVRAGGGTNETDWQLQSLTQGILDAGEIELDPLSLPYADQPTPSPSATPTLSPTPSPSPTATLTVTPTLSAPAATPTATPALIPTLSPAVTLTARPTQPAAVIAGGTPTIAPPITPTLAASVPASATSRSPTRAPPPATPRAATPLAAPAAGATGPRASSPTARPTEVTASPTPPALNAPEESEPVPDGLKALLIVAASLLASGSALAAIGIVKTLRRRAA